MNKHLLVVALALPALQILGAEQRPETNARSVSTPTADSARKPGVVSTTPLWQRNPLTSRRS